MKQYITWKQMNELEDGQLAELLNMEEDLFVWAKEACINQEFTIGKMIEIIHSYDWDMEVGKILKKWYVDTSGYIHTEEYELVDALWEQLKYILEEEENANV